MARKVIVRLVDVDAVKVRTTRKKTRIQRDWEALQAHWEAEHLKTLGMTAEEYAETLETSEGDD